jgi:deferrochelatase/peroxidase EfeB
MSVGFNDGISQPAVAGFIPGALPDEQTIAPGIILMGHDGGPSGLPEWTKDGTILAFRHLKQLVPEFNHFLEANPIVLPGLPRDQGSELLGYFDSICAYSRALADDESHSARLMGRWKSGTF